MRGFFPKTFVFLVLSVTSAFSSQVFSHCLGVVTAGGGIDFWNQVEKGATRAGEDNNVTVIVRGPINVVDTLSQKLIVEQMIDAGCTGLAVAPNSEARINQVKDLALKGTPVVLIDRDYGSNNLTVVKTNNVAAGRLAAQKMGELLPDHSDIALLRLHSSVSSTSEREFGFLEQAKLEGLRVSYDITLGTNQHEATLAAYNLLNNHSTIKGVFSPNESTTLAALKSRKRLNDGNEIVHVGFDSHPEILEAVRTNSISAVVVQKPYEMGYEAVESLIQILDNETVPSSIETPVLLVTKDNLRALSGL